MDYRKRRPAFHSGRIDNHSGIGFSNNSDETNSDLNQDRIYKCIWTIALLIGIQTPVLANTTVSSPNSTSTGVVNNNATMITPGMWPVSRYSMGIQCVSPSVTFSPYITDGRSWQTPRKDITRTPIYEEDTGNVLYYSEIPRFEKDSFNLNMGASLQFNIPLGKGVDLCHQAVKVNIENQKLLQLKTKYEINLHRLAQCSAQIKLGVRFRKGSDSAVTCHDVEVVVPANQVLPHHHSLSSSQ
tara:strand:+ start:17296 stop:18021 length:726 start_codon:yes stop_codon:yes gene_type:complete